MHRHLVKPEIRVATQWSWSPHFQCITIRGIFEVVYAVILRLIAYAKLSATHAINYFSLTVPYHKFCGSAALHGGLIIIIAR